MWKSWSLTPAERRAALLEFEKRMAASVAEVHEVRAVSFVVDGDLCAINWVFDFTDSEGRRTYMDKVAWQTWHGDKIVSERFYYDPAALHG